MKAAITQRTTPPPALWRRLVMIGALLGLLLGACGISGDDAPRDINTPANDNSAGSNQADITATSTSLIYLVSHDTDGKVILKPIARDVAETIDNALDELLSGPTLREEDADLTTALPDGMQLNSVTLNGDLVTIDVTSELASLSGEPLVLAVGQLVLTAAGVAGVASVVITVDGHPTLLPRPNGDVLTDPLTRADYTSLLVKTTPKSTDPTVAPTSPTAASTTVAQTQPTTPVS